MVKAEVKGKCRNARQPVWPGAYDGAKVEKTNETARRRYCPSTGKYRSRNTLRWWRSWPAMM